jgi:putative ABC transport system permease protein
MGASTGNILVLLGREFVWAILAANVFAWPTAYYLMNRWLNNFAYRIDIGLGLFVLSAGAALGIALLAVSWQSVKAAVLPPAESLRYE